MLIICVACVVCVHIVIYGFGGFGLTWCGVIYMLMLLIVLSMGINVGRALPLQWLGPTRSDWTNLAPGAVLFKECLIPSQGASEKECLPAVRFSKFCIDCVASFEKLVFPARCQC